VTRNLPIIKVIKIKQDEMDGYTHGDHNPI
jgi:hypothetical protein